MRQGDEWGTPLELFAALHAEFDFDLDVAASKSNAKCDRYYDRAANGLALPWRSRVWCNPPYSRGSLELWVRKAAEATRSLEARIVVMLLPATTSAAWWHDVVHRHAREVRFVRGRIGFGSSRRGRAPFDSAVVIFDWCCDGPPEYTLMRQDALCQTTAL